jgi:glycosyltransferase involved in cell wall biosynthesis
LLNPTGTLGGGERSLLDLLASLRGHDPSIEPHLIACDDGPLLAEAARAGATVELLPMPPVLARAGDSSDVARWKLVALGQVIRAGIASLRFARTLRTAIAAARPDVVHSNGLKTHLLAGMAPLPGVPLVWHVRDFVSSRPIASMLLARSVRARPTVIAVSRAVADDVRAALRVDPIAVHVIPNGIDTDHFAPSLVSEAADLDGLAGLAPAPRGALRVGLVATYARWKGQDLFLRAAGAVRAAAAAAAAAAASRVTVRFYIVGGPIYRTTGSQFRSDELIDLARQVGLGDVVGLIPFQPDPAPVYRALDVVVHASTRPEPFGRTIVEAMSCGRAVVVSNEGGAAELIRDGHDALAFRPRDAGSLAAAIVRLLEDPALRARLGAAARRAAVERFDRRRLGAAVGAVYQRLLGEVSA